MLDLWYKNAVIYSLNVASHMDGNDDGIGDFKGSPGAPGDVRAPATSIVSSMCERTGPIACSSC